MRIVFLNVLSTGPYLLSLFDKIPEHLLTFTYLGDDKGIAAPAVGAQGHVRNKPSSTTLGAGVSRVPSNAQSMFRAAWGCLVLPCTPGQALHPWVSQRKSRQKTLHKQLDPSQS